MSPRETPALALAFLAAACAAEGGTPLALLDYEAVVPPAFEIRPATSRMRLAELSVPPSGSGAAEVIVYYFGPGQGGSAEANIVRWTGQFTGPDGGPVAPRVTTPEGTELPTTVAELEGTYARGVGMGTGTPEAGQALIAAVVETPRGNLFLQLVGDREAVAAAREPFLRMVTSIRPAAGSV